jgi:hypothetical protein
MNKLRVSILGLGHYSAAGAGMNELSRSIRGEKHLPSLKHLMIETQNGAMEVPYYSAPDPELPHSIPESIRRRLSRIAKMSFMASREALGDAFTDFAAVTADKPERIGIVVGTSLGCLESANQYLTRVTRDGSAGASPSLFASSMHNSIAAQLAIFFGIRGPNSTVTTMDHSTLGAVELASLWLRADMIDHALVVVGDEMADYQPYMMAHVPGFQKTHLKPLENVCTTVAGEGVTSFVLSRDSGSRVPYAQLGGSVITSSAQRIFVASHGERGQWDHVVRWRDENCLGSAAQQPELLCHAQHYGGYLTSFATEIALAASLVRHDRQPAGCLQISRSNEIQSLLLEPATS